MVLIIPSGPTSGRPVPPDSGSAYIDTDVSRMLIIGDGTGWRDAMGVPVSSGPRNMRATVNPDNSIVLAWDPMANATSYKLYEDQSPSGVTGATALTTTSTTRTPSTMRIYHYWVTAMLAGGVESEPSAKAQATLPYVAPTPGGGGTPPPTGNETTEVCYLTGYSYQDNTPPGSAVISLPIIHQVAGGQGTYDDPITAAVPGHADGTEETPGGVKFYVADLKRYFIVEDTGATKYSNIRHFDLWVDGQNFAKSDSDACMNSYTGNHTCIFSPAPGHPVTPGPLTGPGGCVI